MRVDFQLKIQDALRRKERFNNEHEEVSHNIFLKRKLQG